MAAAPNLENKQTSNKGYHKTRSRLWAVSLFLENLWGRMWKKKVCKRNMQVVMLLATSTCSMGIRRRERETALVSYHDLDTTLKGSGHWVFVLQRVVRVEMEILVSMGCFSVNTGFNWSISISNCLRVEECNVLVDRVKMGVKFLTEQRIFCRLTKTKSLKYNMWWSVKVN